MKILKRVLIILFLMIFFIPSVYALETKIKKIEIQEKSNNIKISNYNIDGLKIHSNILFKKKNDYVTFKLLLDINPKEYKINSVTDNNKNKNVKSSYKFNKDNIIFMTLKYENELTQELNLKDFEINIDVIDEEGNIERLDIIPKKAINPDTRDIIIIYVIILLISLSILLGTKYIKKKKYVINIVLLLIMIIPVNILAKSNTKNKLIFSTKNINVGYDILFQKDDSSEGEMEQIECIYGKECRLPKNRFEKEDKLFAGWSLQEDGEVDFEDEEEVKNLIAGGIVKLYPVWKNDDRVPLFDVGKIVNTKIKLLVLDEKYNNQSLEEESVYFGNLRRVYEKPNINNFDETNIISSPNSKEKIYAWSENYDILWYADSDIVYLNEDSSYLFANMPSNSINKLDTLDTSLVKDASYMFAGRLEDTYENSEGLSNWNTSNITNMEGMFKNNVGVFYTLLSNWDVSNVTNMRNMFLDVFSFETLQYYPDGFDASPIKDWDIRKVTDFSNMFGACWLNPDDEPIYPEFTILDGFWNNDIETIDNRGCRSGTFVLKITYNLTFDGNGNTSGTMQGKTCLYLDNCIIPLNQFVKDGFILEGWSDSPNGDVKYKNGGFIKLPLNSDKTVLYAIWGEPRTTTTTIVSGSIFNKKAKLIECGETQDRDTDYYLLHGGEYVHIVDEQLSDIMAFIRSNTIPDNSNFTSLNIISTADSDRITYIWTGGDYNEILYYYTDADIIYLNENSSKMFKGFFMLDPGYSGNFERLNTSRVKNMSEMFYRGGTYDFSFELLKNWDVSNVTNMSYMFSYILDVDMYSNPSALNDWDVRKVTNFNGMFYRTGNGKYLLPIFKKKPGKWVGSVGNESYTTYPYEEGTYYIVKFSSGSTDFYNGYPYSYDNGKSSYIYCFYDQDCILNTDGGYNYPNHTVAGFSLTYIGEVVYHKNDVVRNLTTEDEITLYVKWN